MKKCAFFIFMTGFFCLSALGQVSIEVADNTIKVGGHSEMVFYYGFAQGDQLIFSFEVLNGKELKELEITELPSSSKFMDYKTKKIKNKMIHVTRTGIYKFKFTNASLAARICQIQIQRIPSGLSTKNFNSSVYWRTVEDTIYSQAPKRYLVKSDTLAQTIVDQVTKVCTSSPLNRQGDKEVVEFTLPNGTVSWSYYIGVGTEGQKAFNRTKVSFINTAAAVATHIPGYGTMAALALYGLNTFQLIQGEDNVKYSFISDSKNALLYKNGQGFKLFHRGNVLNDASQMKEPLAGKIYLGLLNDNLMESIEVKVNVTAIILKQKWATQTSSIRSISIRQEAYLKN